MGFAWKRRIFITASFLAVGIVYALCREVLFLLLPEEVRVNYWRWHLVQALFVAPFWFFAGNFLFRRFLPYESIRSYEQSKKLAVRSLLLLIFAAGFARILYEIGVSWGVAEAVACAPSVACLTYMVVIDSKE